jgi:hypothetical protein
MLQQNVVNVPETLILRSVTFFENREFYEIMWETMVQAHSPQMAI